MCTVVTWGEVEEGGARRGGWVGPGQANGGGDMQGKDSETVDDEDSFQALTQA